MKTSRLLLLAGLLAGAVSFALAGPAPQFWSRPAPSHNATAVSAAKATAPAATPSAPACSACSCRKKG